MARRSTRTLEPSVKTFERSDRIRQLIEMGSDNDAVMSWFEGMHPEIILNDAMRREKSKGKYLPPNKILRDEIANQIRVVRHQYEKDRSTMAANEQRFHKKTETVLLSEAVPEQLIRLSLPEKLHTLAEVWGWHEEKVKGKTVRYYGPPRGKITLVGGERGVGKSRTLIMLQAEMIADSLVKRPKNPSRMLVFQNEVKGGGYAKWFINYIEQAGLPKEVLNYVCVSDETDLDKQVQIMKDFQPDFVIIDSLKIIPQAKTESGQYELCMLYATRAAEMGIEKAPHMLFIAHMNKSGEIKGSTAIQHFVDVIFYITKHWVPGEFKVACPDKNRYGETGISKRFRHRGAMVEPVPTNQGSIEPLNSLLRAAS